MAKLKPLLLLLPLTLALCSCATPAKLPEPAPPAVVELAKARLTQPDPEMMEPVLANFQERLLDYFQQTPVPSSLPSPAKPTSPP